MAWHRGRGSLAAVGGGFALVAAVAALAPPVHRLRSGVIAYRAYEPDGIGRFERVIGPRAQRVGGEGWLAERDVTPACRAAAVAAEDVRFHRHRGIDPVSIARALRLDLSRGRVVWGGSSITQQLVKNLFLEREKGVLRKLRELLGAVLLDRLLSKERQLTWYLNVAEFGPRIYGLEAAAQARFGKQARELSLAECVALFARLPDPIRSDRELARGRAPRRIVVRWDGTLRALARGGSVSPQEIACARDELFRSSLRSLRSRPPE